MSPSLETLPTRGFEAGHYGMIWGGHTGNWSYFNQMKDLDWDIEMLPKGPAGRKGAELSMDAFGISKDCEDKEAAWTFLKFLCSKESQMLFAKKGCLVSRRSVSEAVLLREDRVHRPKNIQAVYKSLDYAQSIPQSPDFIELINQVIQPEMDLLTAGGDKSAEEVCRDVTKSANAFLKTMGNSKR